MLITIIEQMVLRTSVASGGFRLSDVGAKNVGVTNRWPYLCFSGREVGGPGPLVLIGTGVLERYRGSCASLPNHRRRQQLGDRLGDTGTLR